MPTIAAGSSPTITLTAGQRLRFAAGGSGLANVLRPGALASQRYTPLGASPAYIGPFSVDHQISIICERALTYTLVPATLNAVSQDPSTYDLYADMTKVGAGKGLVTLGYRASGSFSSPINTFNGASSSGVFGIPEPMLIPGGTLTDGFGLIRGRATVRKTGTDAASFFQIQGGPLNSLSDPNLLSGASNVTNTGWSATGLEVVFEFTMAYKSGRLGTTFRRSREGDGSLSQQVGEFTSTWDNTVDNYLNFAISGATAGNTYDLLDYEVQIFR